MIITIDGPSGAGKSTVAKMLADRLGFYLVDTGAIYRAFALFAQRQQISFDDEAALAECAKNFPIRFQRLGRSIQLFLGQEELTRQIRTPAISEAASRVSPYESVRALLLPLQRKLALEGSCIVEGRDIGTVVLPEAEMKFFLTARPEVRAKRRKQEFDIFGMLAPYHQVLREQTIRDDRDAGRAVAPLLQPADSIYVDTSNLTLIDVVDHMEKLYRRMFKNESSLGFFLTEEEKRD